jgi:RNA polymerase sigma factor (sigma-70 family)
LPEPDDEALVARLRRGDGSAWVEFLDRYERLIYAVPRRMGLDPDDAADVFQEVVIAFLNGLPRLREPKTLPRWLTQTAFRIARDRRARGRREVRPKEETFWNTVVDSQSEVEGTLAVFEARRDVRAALEQVSPQCRELLTLLFLTDPAPSYTEIAHRLARPVGSLGPTRQRCLERMLEALAKHGIKAATDSTLKSSPPSTRVRKRSPR